MCGKAIKAVLTWHQVSFRKTHDLDELKQVCVPLVGDAGAHLAASRGSRSWRFRYPGPVFSERTEAEEARHTAGRLLDALAAQLESEFGD